MENNKSNFNQAIWLAISYTCSMLVGILSSVILSRYFDKVQYGTYKQIIYVYNTLITVFYAGLPAVFTYFLPRYSKSEGKYIVRKLHNLLFILGFCFSATLFLGSNFIASLLNNPELAVGLKIFSLFPLFTLPTAGVEGIYVVNKNTRFVAIYNVVTRLLMLACLVIPVVFIKNDYRYAVVGWGVASFIAFVIAIVAKNKIYQDVDYVKIQNISKDILKYSLPIMGSSLVLMAFNSANQFFISRYYGTVAFAEYSNGYMALPFVPIFIAPVRSLLTPIFAKASSEGNYDEALGTLRSSTMQIMTIMIPLIVLSFVCAKDIMVFLYSSAYERSFIYFRLMLVFNFCEMFVFSGVLSAIGKTKTCFIIDLICTVMVWVTDFFMIKTPFCSPYLIMAIFVAMNIMMKYVIRGVYLVNNEKMNILDKPTIVHGTKIMLHTIIVGYVLSVFSDYCLQEIHIFWRLVICTVCFYTVLLASMRIIKVNYLNAVLRFIKKK